MTAAELEPFVIRAFVVVSMLSLGLQATRGSLAEGLRRPRQVLLVALLDLLVIPVLGALLVRVMDLPLSAQVAIIAMSAAPGAAIAPRLVEMGRGDASLAVTLMIGLSAIAAVIAAPLTIVLLASAPGGPGLDTPGLLIGLVLTQVVPLSIGVAWRHRAPRSAARVRQLATRGSNLLIVVLVPVVLLSSAGSLASVSAASVGAMVLMYLLALVLGMAIGNGWGPIGRTLGIISAQRSGGLALLVVGLLAVPGAAAVVVVNTLLVFLASLLLVGGLTLLDRRRAVVVDLVRGPNPVP